MDDYICDKCNGTGWLVTYFDETNTDIKYSCRKCNGSGKVNWIENIFGKQEEGFHFATYTAPIIIHPYPPINIVGE